MSWELLDTGFRRYDVVHNMQTFDKKKMWVMISQGKRFLEAIVFCLYRRTLAEPDLMRSSAFTKSSGKSIPKTSWVVS
jgi:hypothetical protein